MQHSRPLLSSIGCWLLALGIAATTATAAAANDSSPPTLPDTPAGESLGWFLATMNNRGADFEIEQRFSPGFLQQLPPPQLTQVLDGSRQQLGGLDLVEITPDGPNKLVARVHARAAGIDLNLTLEVEAEPPHRFTTLHMQPAPPRVAAGDDWLKVSADLAALGRDTAIAVDVVRDGTVQPLHRSGSSAPLALGSSFKLWVLLALADAVDAGTASYAEILPIREAWKSLPGGDLRLSPEGTPHTLAHYAARMIAASDNTATDHLIQRLGRRSVEAAMALHCADPARNVPFLTTRELFVFKLGDEALRTRYLAATPDERRLILDQELADTAPDTAAAVSWTSPVAIGELEWFATAEEMNRTMLAVETRAAQPGHLPLANALRINAGIPFNRDVWTTVSFKGGSEVGVIALVYGLERHDGTRFLFTMLVNDPDKAVEQNAILAVARRAIALLESARVN